MQIPYLARHCRVVTFDGRGNGRSDRPAEPAAYDEDEFAADALAVWTRPATERASSSRSRWARSASLLLAAEHPGARRGARLHRRRRCRSAPVVAAQPRRDAFDERARRRDEGWAKYNRHYWLERLRRLPRVLLLADVHRAALDQADRGRRRLGARDDAGDARRDAARDAVSTTPTARASWPRACAAPCSSSTAGRRDPPHAAASRSPS